MPEFNYRHRWALHAWLRRFAFGYQIAEQFGLNVIPHVRVLYRSWRESEKFMQHSLVFH